jgi:hypothetical protein
VRVQPDAAKGARLSYGRDRKAKRLTGDRKKAENPISSLNESQQRSKREFFNNKQPISVGV